MDVQVDPNLVNQAYKNMLAEAQSQVALLQAAATQLQTKVDELTKDNQELRAQNEQLMQQTGRQDGVPQQETAAE